MFHSWIKQRFFICPSAPAAMASSVDTTVVMSIVLANMREGVIQRQREEIERLRMKAQDINVVIGTVSGVVYMSQAAAFAIPGATGARWIGPPIPDGRVSRANARALMWTPTFRT